VPYYNALASYRVNGNVLSC